MCLRAGSSPWAAGLQLLPSLFTRQTPNPSEVWPVLRNWGRDFPTPPLPSPPHYTSRNAGYICNSFPRSCVLFCFKFLWDLWPSNFKPSCKVLSSPASPAILCHDILNLSVCLCTHPCWSPFCLGEFCLFLPNPLLCTALNNAASVKSPVGPNTPMNSDQFRGL